MAGGVLRAQARNRKSRRLDIGMQVANVARLARAARGKVGRVEIQDQRTVLEQDLQRDIAAFAVLQHEIRRFAAWFQHSLSPSGPAAAAQIVSIIR